MPSIDYHALQSVVAVRDVLAHLGAPELRNEHGGGRGECPLKAHGGRPPRCFRLLRSGLWWCYKCGKGGDALSLWRELHPDDAYSAAHSLCAALGKQVPYVPRARKPRSARNREEAM